MKHQQVHELLDAIHKNKYYTPTEWERNFLDDLSFYATIGNIKVSDKQSKMLQKIYRKSQEVV